ncbi:MAG: hypothetical protein JRK53_17275 [Deltaproteobacteria bacterium]|nr:hypothetical protein [Deltaproteobacteria bacterium]MBW2284124.1 hypothetical protein [Deltaproteobacteria bacterium]
MEKVEVKFGEWFENGFTLYKKNFVVLVLASLIALLVSAATLGILAGPMIAGMLLITLRLHDGEDPKPEVGTLFKGFDYFLNSLLFVVVWGAAVLAASFLLALVPCIGQLAALFVIYAAQTALMFGMFLIVDLGMDFWSASQRSYRVVKTNFWIFLGFAVVAGIIGSIGGIACGIGVAVTAPIQACAFTVAYRDVFSNTRPEPVVGNEINESVPADSEG